MVISFQLQVLNWEIYIDAYELPGTRTTFGSEIDGLLVTHRTHKSVLTRAIQKEIPLVIFGMSTSRTPFTQFDQFFPDEQAIGALVADHLAKRGFQSYAYCHHPMWPMSHERGSAFASFVRQNGNECKRFSFRNPEQKGLREDFRRLRSWLKQLTLPVGIFALNDIVALSVIRAAHEAGVACPGDLAIVGVDNDELLCNAVEPSLSSVDTDWMRMGYEAAEHLDALIEGQSANPERHKIPPRQIAVRSSTDFLAVPDDDVVKALCYIRSRASEPLTTADVLGEVLLSRPTLDNRFKKYLGHTVADEIIQTKIARAKRLLLETDMPVTAVSEECGFAYPDHLFRQFRKVTGQTPGQYRDDYLAVS